MDGTHTQVDKNYKLKRYHPFIFCMCLTMPLCPILPEHNIFQLILSDGGTSKNFVRGCACWTSKF